MGTAKERLSKTLGISLPVRQCYFNGIYIVLVPRPSEPIVYQEWYTILCSLPIPQRWANLQIEIGRLTRRPRWKTNQSCKDSGLRFFLWRCGQSPRKLKVLLYTLLFKGVIYSSEEIFPLILSTLKKKKRVTSIFQYFDNAESLFYAMRELWKSR